ncbi:MAG: hypothetical protein J6I66_03725 [Lachnospiraceae bacterium]|nr:hypothetical protein [Lachnospiraceae bacterium]
MKQLFDSDKFKKMVFFILAVIVLISLLSLMSRIGSETLTDYAEKNPETAYAETDSSWRDAYDSTDAQGK